MGEAHTEALGTLGTPPVRSRAGTARLTRGVGVGGHRFRGWYRCGAQSVRARLLTLPCNPTQCEADSRAQICPR